MREQLILDLNSVAQTWWNWMWPMSWQLVILVCVLGAVTWLLRNRSARLRYALWLLVPVRLILPPTLALVTGWGWWILPADHITETETQTQILESIPVPSNERIADEFPVPQPSMNSQPMTQRPSVPLVEMPTAMEIDSINRANESIKSVILKPIKLVTTITWQSWLFLGWILGVVLLLMRLAYGLIQAHGLIRRSEVSRCSNVVELLEKCRRSMGLRRKVRLRELDGSGVPLLVGIIRPTIILPKKIDGCLTSSELEAVLFHELHHVSRFDAFVNLSQSLLASVYFFHPLIWLSNRVLSHLREDACDEATVAVLNGQRSDYGAGIVKIAEMVTDQPPGVALGIISRKGQVKRRLQRILDPRLSLGRRLSWSGLVLLLILGTILLPTAARPIDSLTATKIEPASDSEAADEPSMANADVQKKDKIFAEVEKTTAKKEDSENSQPEPSEDLVTLSGTVVDEKGKPARKVKVFVNWNYPESGRVETETDDLGRFLMHTPSQNLLYGQVVQAIADSGQQQAHFRLPWQNVENDASLKKILLRLHPARQVKLHVVDGADKPIANAKTGVMGGNKVWGTKTTDTQGNTEFLVPYDAQIQFLFALSKGHGVDYKAYVLPRGRAGDLNARAPVLPEIPVRLTLDGVMPPLEVQVVGADDRPIPGLQVYPWYLEKPDQPQDLNLSFFVELVQETTNQSGKAVFNWIPHWHKKRLTIWPRDKEHVSQRAIYDPEVGNGKLTMKLNKLVPISGQVTFPDGSPAKNVPITARGEGYQSGQFAKTIKTDSAGRYTFNAYPNKIYLIFVNDKKWASTPHTGFALWPGKPIDHLDFKLRPVTRLFGRVTVGSPPVPVKGQAIDVYQYGVLLRNLKDVNLPNPENRNENRAVQPTVVHKTVSNENGEYELFVGDGKFDIRGPDQNKIEKFEIAGELERQFDFHASRPDRGILEGSVVSGNPPQPVSGAEVFGIYRHILQRLDMKAVTDPSGKFKVERYLHRTVVYARSKDKKLAGVVEIGPDDKTVIISLRPRGTATGLLIDETTKKPLKESEIRYGVKVHLGNNKAPWRTAFGGTTKTDSEGRFEIRDLVLGQNYNLTLIRRFKDQPDRPSMRSFGEVKTEDTQSIDLGALEVTLPYKLSPTKKQSATSVQKVKKEVSASSKKKPLEDQITLSGIVVDENGKPARKVKVFVEWLHPKRDRVESETDNLGRFLMHASSQNVRYKAIQAVADSGQQLAQYQLPWQNIENDQSLQKLRLQLHPARRVELHVVDGSGKPIANAKTGILGDRSVIWGTGLTDDKGQIQFLVPHDVEVQFACAFSDNHGCDYKAYVLPRGQSGDKITKPPALPDHPIRLTLDGAQPLEVNLKETDGRPIAGIKLSPWLLNKPDQSQELNLGLLFYNSGLLEQATDPAGKTTFQWIPRWQKTQLVIWPRNKEYVHQRGVYDPKTGNGTLTMKLEKLVPISGRVTYADGSPAKEISVTASGRGHQTDRFEKTIKTDSAGRYTIKAAPDMVYLVIANDKKWASTTHTGFALWPGKPIQNLDFKLRPATRLHGRVTVGSPPRAVKGQSIYVYQYGDRLSDNKDIKLPNPENRNWAVQPIIVHSTSSDENGEYELFVGDGKFDIRGPAQISNQNSDRVIKFEIAGELEKEFNFHAIRPEKGILEGTVVTGNPPQPVSDAEIDGIYRATLTGRAMKAITDKSGKFKVERELHRTVVYARSKDKKLAGVVEIGPDDKTVTVPIRPLGNAFAQLIDATTKKPLKEREIQYGVEVRLGGRSAPFRTSFGGTTTTDSEGRFEVRNLVLGQNYKISLVERPKDQPNRVTWRHVGKVKPEGTQPIDLGALEVSPPPAPYKPPTLNERIAAAFNVKGTPFERFKRAKLDAKITMQHLLILFGDPKSETVKQFMTLRYQDQDVGKALNSFVVLAISTAKDKRKTAEELANALGENIDGTRTDFLMVVANEQGKRLENADVGSLSADGKISKQMLLKLLKANTLQPLDAQELLATALKKAKKDNKRIIIQETATWCAPCRLLSRFLEKERHQWERDYIWIKMDHRWTGAREMMNTMRDGAEGGVPWWAILDKNGKVLVTSNDKDGKNIGFPSNQHEIAHFQTMLEKTAIRLTPMETNSLVDSLKQKD